MNKTVEEEIVSQIVCDELSKDRLRWLLKQYKVRLLTSQRQALRDEIGKMEDTRTSLDDDDWNNRNIGYNTAIADVLSLIDNN